MNLKDIIDQCPEVRGYTDKDLSQSIQAVEKRLQDMPREQIPYLEAMCAEQERRAGE